MMADEGLQSATATVRNPRGLHMRPLELIAKKAMSFPCDIHVIRGVNRVDAKSFLHLLTLGAEAGMQLSVEAVGRDAESAVAQLVALIESNFEAFENPVRTV
jgi:phosphocarrier protein HPr